MAALSALSISVNAAVFAQTEPTPNPPSPTIPRPPQTPGPQVPPPPSPQTPSPGTAPNAKEAPGETLTEKLDRNEGVIKPPPVGDPDIVMPPPDTNAKIKVIPPPGEPGGDPNVQPK